MNKENMQHIITRSKIFFRDKVVTNHLKNTEKLTRLSAFNVNPFIHKYLAQFAFGDSSPESLAKALIYPRVLGTSITTTFGTQLQNYCNEVLSSYASVTAGMDIEFIDAEDNRRKYCQIKSGPQTINKDDVKTIKDHFKAVLNLSRTNHLNLSFTDCVVGILYGDDYSINQFYREINETYPVYIGAEFWYHLTGDRRFYYELINAFSEVALEMDSSATVQRVIKELAEDISNHNH